jgi:predicted DNA-binding transcriptional regulator YafY
MPQKLEPFASPSEKILGLFSLLLFTGERYSLTRLAGLLGCSKQSVLRMIEQIEHSNEAQVESWLEGGQRWFRMRTPPNRPHVALPPESIQYLVLCKELVWHMLPQAMRREIDSALHKATVLLPDMEERPRALAHVMDVSVKGAIDYTPHHAAIDALLRAIGEERVCRVTYRSARSTAPREHLYAPLRLASYREALYAMGAILDHDRPEVVKYTTPLAVQRMFDVTLTDMARPPTVCGEDACRDFGFVRGKSFRVKVKFEADVAHYVRERIWSADQRITEYRNGKLLLEFTARSDWEVVSWILGFGRGAELIGPPELKRMLRDELAALWERYGKRVKGVD